MALVSLIGLTEFRCGRFLVGVGGDTVVVAGSTTVTLIG